jgi:hypothetical protein
MGANKEDRVSQKEVPFLQSWLTLAEAAAWMRIAPRKLAALSKHRGSRIPAVWFNRQTCIFNPATIIAKLAGERNVDPEMIRAILNMKDPETEWKEGNKITGRPVTGSITGTWVRPLHSADALWHFRADGMSKSFCGKHKCSEVQELSGELMEPACDECKEGIAREEWKAVRARARIH